MPNIIKGRFDEVPLGREFKLGNGGLFVKESKTTATNTRTGLTEYFAPFRIVTYNKYNNSYIATDTRLRS